MIWLEYLNNQITCKMISKVKYFFLALRNRQRVQICLAKGTASMFDRSIDLTNPISWEFSGFSQNGEDGIIDVLRSQLKAKNRYFIEIGAADGIDNNSACAYNLDGIYNIPRRTYKSLYVISCKNRNHYIWASSVSRVNRACFKILNR